MTNDTSAPSPLDSRFKMLRLFDGGQGNLPTAWRVYERVRLEDDPEPGPRWRKVCEGPGETAELIEVVFDTFCLHQSSQPLEWIR